MSIIILLSGLVLLLPAIRASDAGVSGTCSGPCTMHPAFRERIRKDVAWLDDIGGITDAMIRNISLVCNVGISHQCNSMAVRMMIKDGEIYLNSIHPDWRLGPPEFIGFLLELYETSKLYRLPDLEFAFNGNDDAVSPAFDWKDRAKLQSVFHGGPFPLLAWSKSDASFAQLVPYSGAFRCTDDSFDALLTRLDDIRRVPWAKKQKVAFGRWNQFCPNYHYKMPNLPSGESFPCARGFLPKLAEEHKDLLDIGITGANGVRPVPLQHQDVFRYLVSTDGWAISSKFDKYLLLGSTILKATSSRYGFYYDALRPGEHYLPFLNKSRQDILDVVRWAQQHDDQAAAIAANAQQFAVRHLHRNARLCYYRSLIEELGKKMRYTPDCSQRKLCIPLGRMLEFLSSYPRTAQSCRYQEVFLRHGTSSSPPSASSARHHFSDEELTLLHQEEKHWPRDTDIPPLQEEPYF
ncbi:hypothetical protein Agub_g6423, partial [Astrephomene gubernaculifera]